MLPGAMCIVFQKFPCFPVCFFQTYVRLYLAHFFIGKMFVCFFASLVCYPNHFVCTCHVFLSSLDNGSAVWPYGKMFHPKLPSMVTLIMSSMNPNSDVNSSPGDPCFIIHTCILVSHSSNDFYMARIYIRSKSVPRL